MRNSECDATSDNLCFRSHKELYPDITSKLARAWTKHPFIRLRDCRHLG